MDPFLMNKTLMSQESFEFLLTLFSPSPQLLFHFASVRRNVMVVCMHDDGKAAVPNTLEVFEVGCSGRNVYAGMRRSMSRI
jgi:hypothetical protein